MAVVSSHLAYEHPLMHGDQFICPRFLEGRHGCGHGSKLNFPAFVALAALWLARRRARKAVRQRMLFRRPPARSNRGEMQGRMSMAPGKKSPCKGLTTSAAVGKLLHGLEIRLQVVGFHERHDF